MTTDEKGKRKGGLTDVHRAFIIQQVACFMGPTETAAAVNEEFGLNVSRQAIERYDPSKLAGRQMAQRWKELFKITREAFIDHVENRVPHAHKSLRIKKLARASDVFERNGNYIAMARMLEQIAKEVGNVHTNRHEFTGKDGGAIKVQAVEDMTDEQIDAELRRLRLIEGGTDLHSAPESEQ